MCKQTVKIKKKYNTLDILAIEFILCVSNIRDDLLSVQCMVESVVLVVYDEQKPAHRHPLHHCLKSFIIVANDSANFIHRFVPSASVTGYDATCPADQRRRGLRQRQTGRASAKGLGIVDMVASEIQIGHQATSI